MAHEVVGNSAIEGVNLDLESVRASMLQRLGVATSFAHHAGHARRLTNASRATAGRDLAELAELGLVVPYGEARGASCRVDLDRFLPAGFRDPVMD
jgi:Fic family protein